MVLGMTAVTAQKDYTQLNVEQLLQKGDQQDILHINISCPKNCPDLEKECCRYLFRDSISSTLQEAIERVRSAYDSYKDVKKKEVDSIERMIENNPKVNLLGYEMYKERIPQVGTCQTYRFKRMYKVNGQLSSDTFTILYDFRLKKILTFDDIFVPEVAAALNENAQGRPIHMMLHKTSIECGAEENGNVSFEKILFIENEHMFTDNFKQSIDLDKIKERITQLTEKKAQEIAAGLPTPEEEEIIIKTMKKVAPKIDEKLKKIILKDFKGLVGAGKKYETIEDIPGNLLMQNARKHIDALLDKSMPFGYWNPVLIFSVDNNGNLINVSTTLPNKEKNIAIVRSLPKWYTSKAFEEGKTYSMTFRLNKETGFFAPRLVLPRPSFPRWR